MEKLSKLNAQQNQPANSAAPSSAVTAPRAAQPSAVQSTTPAPDVVMKPVAKPVSKAEKAAARKQAGKQTAPPKAPAVPAVTPAAKQQPPANASYAGKALGFQPIEAPLPPVSAQKQAALQALLARYMANQISPDEYQKERAAILAGP